MKCRSCETEIKKPFLNLGNQPLSNSYLSEAETHGPETTYPLEVHVCPNCFLVQLEEFKTARQIFSKDYAYFSSYSKAWLKHCEAYVNNIKQQLELNSDSLVIEIASNDGYLLQYFQKYGIPVFGIEPALNTARVAAKKGIPTAVKFFDEHYAKTLDKADLVIGNNVLAHNPDLNGFIRGMKTILKPEGTITMEFPHLLKLMEQCQFDTIYHEHFSYFSLHSVIKAFARQGLRIYDVEELPTHGGSLRIYARHSKGRASKRVEALLKTEEATGLTNLRTYAQFNEEVKQVKRSLLSSLIHLKEEGKTIVGFGAAAKGNTLLNYCGIRTDFLDYVVDDSPHKQGKFLPGTKIPIHSPEKIKKTEPDYLLILPWNWGEEIMKKCSYIREWDGKFIIPIPEVRVIK